MNIEDLKNGKYEIKGKKFYSQISFIIPSILSFVLIAVVIINIIINIICLCLMFRWDF